VRGPGPQQLAVDERAHARERPFDVVLVEVDRKLVKSTILSFGPKVGGTK
jgi:hypothetical protein